MNAQELFNTWWKITLLILGLLLVVILPGFAFPTWYTIGKPEDSSFERGVFAEGSYQYTGNNSATYTSDLGSWNEKFNMSTPVTQTHVVGTWGSTALWGATTPPPCHQIGLRFSFAGGTSYTDNTGQPSNSYKVQLTKRTAGIYDIFVEDKQPEYFDVMIYNALDPGNNHIRDYKFDITVHGWKRD